MEVDAAKLIGAGLAVIGLGGVGAGIGNIFANTISSLARNPAAQPLIQLPMWVGFALVEAIALYALVVALPDRLPADPPQAADTRDAGHLVKARYTPLQPILLGVDEEASPHHELLAADRDRAVAE